jgi:O-methyltransferase involved in polyketide biosynthesis
MDTLRFIASLASETSVVFDYGVIPELLSPVEHRVLAALMARTSEHGEPWKTLFDYRCLAGMLTSIGFSEVADYGPAQLNDRYFSGRKDGLHKSGVSRLVCARV